MTNAPVTTHYDVLVIGSGFGGSVSALRLTEKGYTVGVLEAGARFEDGDLPETSWDAQVVPLRARQLGMYGIQRIDMVKDCMILAGAGVGGGSLVYANTLYEPLGRTSTAIRSWSHITDWKSELAPYYDQAKRMLGVVENPLDTRRRRGRCSRWPTEMGVGRHVPPDARSGVFFGGPGQAAGRGGAPTRSSAAPGRHGAPASTAARA